MPANHVRASALFVAAVAAAFAACTGDGRTSPPSGPLAIKIGTFLPTAGGSSLVDFAGMFSSEPLVAAAWDGRPAFRLAESVVESEDGRHLTVTLRKDAKFHNGEPVTAQVVRDLLAKKKRAMLAEIAGIVALDERRLQFSLNKASSVRPEDLSRMLVDSNEPNEIGLRTGPFKLVSTEPMVLERFDGYYQGKPSVERVEVHEYPTHRAAWTGMMRREVNFLHEVSRDAIDFVEAGGDIRAYPMLRPYYTALVFSMQHAVLKRRDVRVAINEALDRNELVRNGMRGHGRVAESPFWPYHWAYPEGRFPVAFNPEAAKLRLDAAGLKVRPGNPQQMPSRFAFTCLLLAGDARFERIAQLAQRQLYAVGIDMAIEPLPLNKLYPRLMSGDFDAFIMELGTGRNLSWARQMWHSPGPTPQGFPRTGYSAADDGFDRLQVAKSDEEVREALSNVMYVLRADPPAAFLVWPQEARAADASLDIPYETDRDVFGTLWRATPAGPAVRAQR
jgi:peptide/nickel transport system substrate-binding protein